MFLSPAIAILFIMRIFPIIYTLGISFTDWNLVEAGSAGRIVGIQNYISFFKDPSFAQAFFTTFRMGFYSIVFSMLLGVSIAFLMYQDLRGSRFVRGMVISAMIIAPVVVGTSWRLMFNPGNGLINVFLDFIGIGGQSFLAQQETALGAVVLASVWQDSPYVMIIVLAGLQGVPLELFEAAKIDGAGYWQSMRRIVIPLIKKSLVLALIMRTMDALKVFDLVYAMTKGGPGKATLNLNILMYQTGFEHYKLGKSSAISIVILIFISVVCGIMLSISQKKGGVSDGL